MFIFDYLKIIIDDGDKTREQWVSKQLAKLPKNLKIIDAGAGECYYKKYCQHLKYISQDFGKYNGKGDKKGIQTGKRDSSKIDIISDIVDIPIKSSSFDAVLCIEVFEHLPRPLDALKEISRILKKEGVLILSAPFSSLTHYSPYYFYSGFSINFYKENLPRYGLRIKEIYVYGNYFNYVAVELLRMPIVCWRMIGVLSLPIFLVYPIVVPTYFVFRFLSLIFPSSKNLLSFGICVKAQKTKS